MGAIFKLVLISRSFSAQGTNKGKQMLYLDAHIWHFALEIQLSTIKSKFSLVQQNYKLPRFVPRHWIQVFLILFDNNFTLMILLRMSSPTLFQIMHFPPHRQGHLDAIRSSSGKITYFSTSMSFMSLMDHHTFECWSTVMMPVWPDTLVLPRPWS